MMVFGPRACTILYHLFRARRDPRPALIPANVCPQVPLALRRAGQAVRLVDIDPQTLAIDAAACRRLLAGPEAVGAVIHVRPYGAQVESDSLFADLKRARPDLLLIDDACLAPPDIEGDSVSPLADATVFSTGSRKYADLGFGAFAHLAPSVRYPPPAALDFDPAQRDVLEARLAARLEGGLEHADRAAWLDTGPLPMPPQGYLAAVRIARGRAERHKSRIDAIYRDGIPAELQLPPQYQQWRFNVRVPDADAFCSALRREGLFAGRHYRSLGPWWDAQRHPQAEALAAGIVNLFNDHAVDEAAARRIVATLRAFIAGRV
jgi:dTDP-4-amino-4,6-dideoxygalactose transaminase